MIDWLNPSEDVLEAKRIGYEEGYAKGHEDGREKGLDEGYDRGRRVAEDYYK